jgi:RHS repeat-associated protein
MKVAKEYLSFTKSSTDYYPFGMEIPGRKFNSDMYRFGFNGKENDNEINGNGNSIDFGARIYDSRIGRWLTCDPLQAKYPDLNAYNYCADNPIEYIDPDGKEIWIAFTCSINNQTVTQKVQFKNGYLYTPDGKEYSGNNIYFITVQKQLNQARSEDPIENKVVSELDQSKNINLITNIDLDRPDLAKKGNYNRGDGKGGSITKYDPYKQTDVNNNKRNPRVGLIHELKHAFDREKGKLRVDQTTSNGVPLSEVDAINVENKARYHTGDKMRISFGNDKILKKYLVPFGKKETNNSNQYVTPTPGIKSPAP